MCAEQGSRPGEIVCKCPGGLEPHKSEDGGSLPHKGEGGVADGQGEIAGSQDGILRAGVGDMLSGPDCGGWGK
jgi:hypothetical protein